MLHRTGKLDQSENQPLNQRANELSQDQSNLYNSRPNFATSAYNNQPRPSNYEEEQQNQQQFQSSNQFVQQDTIQKAEAKQFVLGHEEYYKSPQFRTCYPLFSRMSQYMKATLCCYPNKNITYVNQINNAAEVKFDENDSAQFRNKVVSLKIGETSNLELDPLLVHPFVKVHVIDKDRGFYIRKSNQEETAITKKETIVSLRDDLQSLNDQRSGATFKTTQCDYIVPFATNCNDLRTYGNSKAQWNETIYINEDAATIYKPNVIILFEILDFNAKFLKEMDKTKLSSDNYYRVCWGYLRPVGIQQNHIGLLKIQLYKYIFDTQKLPPQAKNDQVPLAYLDFIFPDKTKYDGYLTVQLLPVQRPMEKEPEGLFSKHYYEVEGIQNMKNFSTFRKTKHFEDTIEENKIKMKEKDLRKLRRKRGKDKNCEIPNKFIAKFNSGEMGCLRLEFSPDGRYLAAACTLAGYRTVIRIFEVEDEPFKEVFKYRGHKNIIHELSWIQFKQKDQYLLSCSSDFTARVWLVPFQTNNYIGEEESETEYLLTTMNHPSYVYSGKFHPRSYETSSFIIVTACFDSKVRIWGVNPQARGQILNNPVAQLLISVSINQYDEFITILDHRHPNSVTFDKQNGMLYIGDSLGVIHVYDYSNISDNPNQVLKRTNQIKHEELNEIPINCVHVVEQNLLVVHSRDNCIRYFEIQNTVQRLQRRYFGSESQSFPIHSTLSPDGQYVISGSQDGRPHCWTIEGIKMEIESIDYTINGAVSDIAWNNGYHMIAVTGYGGNFPIVLYVYEDEKVDQEQQQYTSLNDKLQEDDKARGQKYDQYNPLLHQQPLNQDGGYGNPVMSQTMQ